MSYVSAVPEVLASASTDLSGIGHAIIEATSAAAPSTTGIVPSALDEVSSAVASAFSGHGQQFQALSTQAAAFHAQFVHNLSAAQGAYASAEVAGSQSLQTLLSAATPNLSISVAGKTLLQLGNAVAQSGTDDAAIAYGDNSKASAIAGTNSFALAVGPRCSAQTYSSASTAIALGDANKALAGDSHLSSRNIAIVAGGHGNEAAAGETLGPNPDRTDHDTAIVLRGEGNEAIAGFGSKDFALVQDGTGLSARANGNSQVSILPELNPRVMSVSISADGQTLVQFGYDSTATSTQGGFGVAIGSGSRVTANGGTAIAIGNSDYVASRGTDSLAISLGYDNTAKAVSPNSKLNVAAVLGGANNQAVVGGDANLGIAMVLGGTRNSAAILGSTGEVALVLGGDRNFATPTGDWRIKIAPSL